MLQAMKVHDTLVKDLTSWSHCAGLLMRIRRNADAMTLCASDILLKFYLHSQNVMKVLFALQNVIGVLFALQKRWYSSVWQLST
jgi:hypothetical protein